MCCVGDAGRFQWQLYYSDFVCFEEAANVDCETEFFPLPAALLLWFLRSSRNCALLTVINSDPA